MELPIQNKAREIAFNLPLSCIMCVSVCLPLLLSQQAALLGACVILCRGRGGKLGVFRQSNANALCLVAGHYIYRLYLKGSFRHKLVFTPSLRDSWRGTFCLLHVRLFLLETKTVGPYFSAISSSLKPFIVTEEERKQPSVSSNDVSSHRTGRQISSV